MPTDVRKDSLRIPKDSYRNAKDAYRIPRDSSPKIAQKWLPNRPPNGSKMAPKFLQNGPPRGPGALLGASWLSTPFVCPYFALQLASWNALGDLRGRKNSPRGPWAALGKIPREVSAKNKCSRAAQERPREIPREVVSQKASFVRCFVDVAFFGPSRLQEPKKVLLNGSGRLLEKF